MTADGSSGAEGQEPQEQQQGSQGQEPGTSTSQFDLDKITDPDVKAYVTALQDRASRASREAADYRTKHRDASTKVTEYERARETDAERTQREAAERDQRVQALEAENRTLKVTQATDKAAVAARAINPATVARMIADQVVLDDKGQPTNIADLIAELKQSDGYLFRRPASTDASSGGGGNGTRTAGSSINDMLRGNRAAAR